MARWIKMPHGSKVCLDPRDIVLDGDLAPSSSKRGQSPPPIIGPCVLRPNSCIDQDAIWYGGRPRPTPYCARWVASSPPPKGGTALQFSARVCCRQTVRWIKMPLGTEVGLGQGDIVLDGDPASPSERGTAPPTFRPMSIVPDCGS